MNMSLSNFAHNKRTVGRDQGRAADASDMLQQIDKPTHKMDE